MTAATAAALLARVRTDDKTMTPPAERPEEYTARAARDQARSFFTTQEFPPFDGSIHLETRSGQD